MLAISQIFLVLNKISFNGETQKKWHVPHTWETYINLYIGIHLLQRRLLPIWSYMIGWHFFSIFEIWIIRKTLERFWFGMKSPIYEFRTKFKRGFGQNISWCGKRFWNLLVFNETTHIDTKQNIANQPYQPGGHGHWMHYWATLQPDVQSFW